jgi:hypothetical protein
VSAWFETRAVAAELTMRRQENLGENLMLRSAPLRESRRMEPRTGEFPNTHGKSDFNA